MSPGEAFTEDLSHRTLQVAGGDPYDSSRFFPRMAYPKPQPGRNVAMGHVHCLRGLVRLLMASRHSPQAQPHQPSH